MRKLPLLLIYSRLALGALIIFLALMKPPYFKAYIVTAIVFGLLSDIFDGIIARRLGVSTARMRRLDSTIDQVFWLCVLICTIILTPQFFEDNILYIGIVLSLEALCYIISYIKFKKEVATHAISSKLWTLVLFATLIQLIAAGHSVILFTACVVLGIITRIEIISIFFIIPEYTTDVPSAYHALKLRKGKPIKRNKLFNG